MMEMWLLPTVVGTLLILAGLWDVFQTLFHPAGRGALSDWITAGVWRAARATKKTSLLMIAGPVGLIAVISAWVTLVALGFALVYWPHLGRDIAFAPGLDPNRHQGFFDAINLSLGSLITVGGDMNSQARWLRLLMGIEAVLGFALLTASLSGLISIYRALERRNSLALHLTLLHHAEITSGIRVADLREDIAFDLLMALAAELASVRADLEQFPITYYFRAQDDHSALPGILPYVHRIAEETARPGRPPAFVMAGTTLGGALDEYLKMLCEHYLKQSGKSRTDIMRAFANDQMREPVDLTPADHQRPLAA